MKIFKEFIFIIILVFIIIEVIFIFEVIKVNKGWEGKLMISLVDGEEIKGIVYLGDGWFVKKDGVIIVIFFVEEIVLFKVKYIFVVYFKIIVKNFL